MNAPVSIEFVSRSCLGIAIATFSINARHIVEIDRQKPGSLILHAAAAEKRVRDGFETLFRNGIMTICANAITAISDPV